jgi:hypothetical protein
MEELKSNNSLKEMGDKSKSEASENLYNSQTKLKFSA